MCDGLRGASYGLRVADKKGEGHSKKQKMLGGGEVGTLGSIYCPHSALYFEI